MHTIDTEIVFATSPLTIPNKSRKAKTMIVGDNVFVRESCAAKAERGQC